MRRAVCPGSYDPPTRGHVDIFGRAAGLWDEVVVLVMVNANKKSLFSIEERASMLREVTADIPNIRIDVAEGLLVDYCRANEVAAIVKGLRSANDFGYELQMAQMNRELSGVDTIFLPNSPAYSFLSSSLVKEVASHQADVSHFVPPEVHTRLTAKFAASPPT